MKRLGLIGAGPWASRYIDTIARRDDCRIVATARRSTRTEPEIAGARRFQTWEGLVQFGQQEHLDGVVVATTPQNQGEVAAVALATGLAVLVEKPLGLSREAVEEVRRGLISSTRRPPVIVNFIHLWAPAYRALKSLLQKDPDSRIVSIDSEGCGNGPFRTWSSLHDYGAHDVALCLDLLGSPASSEVRGVVRLSPPPPAHGELFDADLLIGDVDVRARFGNGCLEKRRRLSVITDRERTLIYDDGRAHPGKLIDDGAVVAVDTRSPLDCVLDDFLGQIGLWRSNNLPPHLPLQSLDFAVKVAGILDDLARAARVAVS